MNINVENIIPYPLKDKLANRNSDVWGKSLSFKKGEQVKITAPSGTGKTTLIHQLYALRNDYSGSVMYDDKNVAQVSVAEMAVIRQSKLSVVFQDLRLLPQLTALENIQLKRALHLPFASEVVMNNMIATLGISHIMQQSASICSYGEQQRIAIVRALMQPFDILLMDEPFSHLDNDNTAKAVQLIKEACNARNAGFVLTDLEPDTHFNYTHQYYL